MRNVGVKKTSSEVVVFLDADVSLTKEWALEMLDVLKYYSRSDQMITGSHCSPPPGENWFLKYWFSSLALEGEVNHIGTGHMLLSRTAFNDIGGFDESLITGEDYDFCQRAKSRGYKIKNNTDLINNPKVIERIQEEVTQCNSKFGKWEMIKRFELTAEEWSIDGGHLTPTMKMKRAIIKKIYQNMRIGFQKEIK